MKTTPTKTITSLINRLGRLVTITTRTPQKDQERNVVKDTRGHPIYTETINTTIARVKVMRGHERIIQNNILQTGDAIGLFKLADAGYLNEDSHLYIKDTNTEGDGQSFNFKIGKPVFKETHIECNLRRSEI